MLFREIARISKFRFFVAHVFYLSPTLSQSLKRPVFHEHAPRARSKFNQTSKRLPAPAEARPRIAIRGSRTNFRFCIPRRSISRSYSVLLAHSLILSVAATVVLSSAFPLSPYSLRATFSVSSSLARRADSVRVARLDGRIAFREIESRFESAGGLSSNTAVTCCRETRSRAWVFLSFTLPHSGGMFMRSAREHPWSGIDDRSRAANGKISLPTKSSLLEKSVCYTIAFIFNYFFLIRAPKSNQTKIQKRNARSFFFNRV